MNNMMTDGEELENTDSLILVSDEDGEAMNM